MVGPMWCVYLLKSVKRRWYYVGSTNDIQRRLAEHNAGKVQSTKSYTPLLLVFKKDFDTEKEAREYERKVKGSRKEKEGIIKKIEGV